MLKYFVKEKKNYCYIVKNIMQYNL